jgi:hypothetical protein
MGWSLSAFHTLHQRICDLHSRWEWWYHACKRAGPGFWSKRNKSAKFANQLSANLFLDNLNVSEGCCSRSFLAQKYQYISRSINSDIFSFFSFNNFGLRLSYHSAVGISHHFQSFWIKVTSLVELSSWICIQWRKQPPIVWAIRHAYRQTSLFWGGRGLQLVLSEELSEDSAI